MSPAEEKPAARRNTVFFVLSITLLVQTTVSLLAAAVAVLAPAIAGDRNWHLGLISLYAPLLYVGAFTVSFRVPWLIGQLGGMGLALAAIAAGTLGLLCLLSPYPAMAVLAALLIGVGYGAMTPASSHILGSWTTPRTAGLIMSIKQVGVPLGAMLAGLLLPYPVLCFGWQIIIAGLAAMSIVLVVTLFPVVNRLNSAGATPPARFRPLEPVRRLMAMPGMTSILLATVVYTGMQLCLRSLLTAYLVRDIGLHLTKAGLALSASQGAGMLGQIIWAWLSDRVMTTHAVLATVGAVMCAGGLAIAELSPEWSFAAIMAVVMMLGFSAAGFIPVILGEVARRSSPGQVGALTSGANLFIIAGAFFGPLAFGGVASALGDKLAFLGLALGAGLTTVGLITARPQSADLIPRTGKPLSRDAN